MGHCILGILAHVDAGKTTLSEGLLYTTGSLKRWGRVDHKDAFLDTHDLERERGITIFSKQAIFSVGETQMTLLDTPGHVDFSSEMERVLGVLDYAIMVVSGSAGVQGHTETLWRLLAYYQIPTILFVNKMDIEGTNQGEMIAQLTQKLGEGFINFSQEDALWQEEVAMTDEEAMDEFLDKGYLASYTVAQQVETRNIFPCYFGSALKLEGITEFLKGLERYTREKHYPKDFGARVYKISRDPQGTRLTHIKVTGGSLKVKDFVCDEEKADQLRLYSGAKFHALPEVEAGMICAVAGLSKTYAGQGLGREERGGSPFLEPVLTYRVRLPQNCQPQVALVKFRQLEEEDPQLRVIWNEKDIQLQLMGQVQREILQRVMSQRFDIDVTFDAGRIVYRETLLEPVIGVGHYEPLRHYAEVHLLLEPDEPGSGITLATACTQEELDPTWQRLILSHLAERTHKGVLTGHPLTDMKITLIAGRGHLKHTQGGDFRQATYRALRQGLMQGKSVLLEPYYSFRLQVPTGTVGRAMTDLQSMSATFDPPEATGEMALLLGTGPVSTLRDYGQEVIAYTKGLGRISFLAGEYLPCQKQEEVVEDLGYQPDHDLEHTADSIFCSHGAGFGVKWYDVHQYQHLQSSLDTPEVEEEIFTHRSQHRPVQGLSMDKELQEIYERTYGKIKRRDFLPQTQTAKEGGKVFIPPVEIRPEYLLVDGYNMIFAWDDLKAMAQDNLEGARQRLMDMLCNYQGFKKCQVILVFDAYKVPQGKGWVGKYHTIHLVYTKEAETADAYIEKTTYDLAKNHRVRVATSDHVEQLIILGHGALRISARMFRMELDGVEQAIAQTLQQNNRKSKGQSLGEIFRQKEEGNF